jgi:molybdenum cofactor synthesis domain-containing protein
MRRGRKSACARYKAGMTDLRASPAAPARESLVQDQFLSILSRDEAARRFEAALDPRPLPGETVALAQALGRVVARDVAAACDAPPFDRSGVDGFAVRSADLASASEAAPVALSVNGEVIACGVAPAIEVRKGTTTPIATGGAAPRGADAIVMIEHTEAVGEGDATRIVLRRPVAPGAFMAFAGSDMARGETVLRKGAVLGSREIAMLAACGLGEVEAVRRPRVGVISTGDELIAPGEPWRPAGIYDANGPVIAAAVTENGGEPVAYGIVRDDAALLEAAILRAHAECDMVVLSGGTSKGAGDLTHRIVARLGRPGILAHGVALKPGKPLCLAVCDGKAVVALPGFPTSAMSTFHDMIAPVLRRLAGLPPRTEARVEAVTTVRTPSELGRTEFVMVSLVETPDGLAAFPTQKGSGSVTAFSQADGFMTVPAMTAAIPAGSRQEVTLFAPSLRAPDVVIAGSHCAGLDAVVSRLADRGLQARILALGSLGGLAAAKRGECDIAPIHLLHQDGRYNQGYLTEGLELVAGWRRLQGVVYRPGDPRFEGSEARDAIAQAIADPACIMVNRNPGAGTRILLDGLLGEARPDGWWNQPKSHNAVAAAVAQSRADWGVAIAPVAASYGLGFLPLADEHYDFAVASARKARPGVAAFLEILGDPALHGDLSVLGFTPAPPP